MLEDMRPQDEQRDGVPASLWQALADAAHEDLVARIWRLDNRIRTLVLALATAPRPDKWPRSPYWQCWYAVRPACSAVCHPTWRRWMQPRRAGSTCRLTCASPRPTCRLPPRRPRGHRSL